ncbi:UNVERIFIED_CONTAM: hypothetical protein Sradi_0119200 [Sesamum radiatum]|uniref:DCD domain-containing protein n=1 Tax=Sesamum radiatum TaxID=300843 RepID=A0AAW2WJU9_SESRA
MATERFIRYRSRAKDIVSAASAPPTNAVEATPNDPQSKSNLLYGIYEATSAGKLNLEPAAFNGKFPAQVKFKIFKECIPLPESVLKQVIKENYTGLKFKQELSGKQVKKLLSSFRPLTTSSSRPAPHPLANVPFARPMPPAATENQFQHTGRRLANDGPYLAEMQYGRIPPIPERGPVHK